MNLLHYRNTFPALNLSVSFIHHDMNTIFIFNFFKTTFCIVNDTEKHSFSFILRTNENNFRDICNRSDQNFVHFLFLSFISGCCLYYKITFQLKKKINFNRGKNHRFIYSIITLSFYRITLKSFNFLVTNLQTKSNSITIGRIVSFFHFRDFHFNIALFILHFLQKIDEFGNFHFSFSFVY